MRRSTFLCLAVLVLCVALICVSGNSYYQGLAITAAVFSLLGMSLNIVYGYLGYISFGHAAFFGLSGYAAGLMALHFGVSFWSVILLATVPATLLGVLVGFASLRISGAYFAITSLTVAEILRLVADNWIDVTRGPMGLVIRRPKIEAFEALGLSFNQYYLIIVVCVALACYAAIAFLMRGPVGRAWLAVREGQDLAESLGVETLFYRVLNLSISGFLAGLAGALLVPRIVVLSPDLLGPTYSATGLLIVLLGGKGTLIGPVIGGTIFAGLPEMLRFVDEYRLAVFAVLLLVVIRLQPKGIAPLLVRFLKRAPHVRAAERDAPPRRRQTVPAAKSGRELLKVQGLTKRFEGLTAVKDVSFSIREGEVVGLMGPNGAGKSTCLGLLSGFIAPTAGTVSFDGQPTDAAKPNRLARRGLVRTFQHTTLFSGLSVFDNVMTAAHLAAPRGLAGTLPGPSFTAFEKQREIQVWNALREVGLERRADEMPLDLPYGEQRLLSIAIALAAGPRLLLLDEPAAGLNPVEAEALADVLRRLRDGGITILLVEHNVRMMTRLCDRIVVLHHGEKIGEGTPAEVQEDRAVRAAYFGEESADA